VPPPPPAGAKSAWLQICISGRNWSVHACTYRSCTLPLRRSHGRGGGGGGQPKSDIRADAMALASSQRSNAFIFNCIKPSVSGGGEGGGGGSLLPSAFIKNILWSQMSACASLRFLKMVFMLPSWWCTVHQTAKEKLPPDCTVQYSTVHIFLTLWLKNYCCFREKCTHSHITKLLIKLAVIVRHWAWKENLKGGWVTAAKSVYLY
jgi:hypothetical protein